MKYNKLVRDRIPEIIIKEGKACTYDVLDDEKYLAELKAKLIEEATEVKSASSRDEMLTELADVREVMDALMQVYEISPMEVSTIQALKAFKKGKFVNKLYLKDVEWAQVSSFLCP